MDAVPHENDDPILRLSTHYWEPADLLFKNYIKLRDLWDTKGKLSSKKERDFIIYLNLWLGMLQVVVEGFADSDNQKALEPWRVEFPQINMHCSSIKHQVDQLGYKLKRFRNAIFHFHKYPKQQLEFLIKDSRHHPLLWAEDLHNEFKMLFSQYRVERWVLYTVENPGAVTKPLMHL